jgi:two-component system response regulator PilR (NtrC family)
VRGIGPEAMAMIRSYGWPGNVRELQNAIELAVAMEQGGLITPDALPQSVRERWETTFSSSPSARDLELPPEGVDLDAILANLEQRYLQMALDLTEGRKTQAAKLLGLSFRSFRYRLAKYHMDDES